MDTKSTKKAEKPGEPLPAVEEVSTETGGTLRVEGLGAAAVALGEALAVGDGGPGVGAARIAEAVAGPAIRTTAIADEAPRPFPYRTTDEALEDHHQVMADASGRPVRVVAETRRAGRDDILPLGRPTLDPDTMPGRRIAIAAAQVRRHGRSYAPGEPFSIDFRAYGELVPIGAIVATPWHELPKDDD